MPVDPVATRRMIESLSTHLEDYLAQWKSSLVDARRDIDSQLAALSDKIPAKAQPLFPEDLLSIMLEDALPPPTPPKIVEKIVEVEKIVTVHVPGPAVAAPAAATATVADWSVVRNAVAAVESARTQVDVLTRFLSQAQTHASRVALLVLRNDRLTGWKAIGFDGSGGKDEAIKSIDLPGEQDPFTSAVLKAERSMLALPPDEGSPLRRALGGKPPARTILVPMVIRDRVAGLLCADELPGEEGRLNESALEVLTFVTGLAVDLLAARKKIPSPSLTPMGEPITVFREVPKAAPAPAPAPKPAAPAPAFDLGEVGATRAMPSVSVSAAPAPAAHSFESFGAPSMPLPTPRPVAPLAAPKPSHDDSAGGKPPITDAREALRFLEESAAVKRKVETSTGMRAPALPKPPAPRSEDLGLTTAIPAAAMRPGAPVPAPPAPAPPMPPMPSADQPGAGELTYAFNQIKAPAPPAPPKPAPPAPPPMAAPPRPAAPVPAPPVAAVADPLLGGGSSAPLAPPPGFIRRSRLAKGDDSQRAVDDAKRLARLLVSEIKLYNERKVEEGKVARDLYERLKDDIERSRQVYEERTPESVRKGTDFFKDELIRSLADGRAEALGSMP